MRGVVLTVLLHISVLFILFTFEHRRYIEGIKTSLTKKEESKTINFPPCASCKILIESFKKGFERTKRGKFEGGDSAWEEDKLGSYAQSEVRLIEIQESLCNDVNRGQAQCHALAEELESTIEDWWFNHQSSQLEIFDFICIEQTKRCCPKDHYGTDCTKCPGYPNKICNNNGKCKGAGTRKGNGACLCDRGYMGSDCFQCAPGHYEAYRDENKLLCTSCHAACNGTCTGPGPRDCEMCTDGWRMIEDKGCYDIDECIHGNKYCPGNQFCVNKEGSHVCLACDRACNGCTGDGPDMCINCAEKYSKKDNICVHSETINIKRKENLARYATYFGLGVATCIILQRNVYVAGFIGLLVSVYIAVSEYTISRNTVQDTTPKLDILGPIT